MRPGQVLNVGEVFAQAMKAYEDGRTPEARRLAKQLLEARPDFGGAHYLTGLLSMDQGQPRRAIEHLARAIAISPGQAVLHLAMGRALELKGDSAEATLHYRTILSLDPSHAEANARLGVLLGKAGRTDEAIGHCRQAVASHPGHAEAWNLLGVLLQRAGRNAEAAEPLRRALALRPEWPAALNNYGVVLRDLGRLDQAVVMLEAASELKPGNAGYRANLAAALRLAGKGEAARVQAERATKSESRNPDAWIELGLARKHLGHPEGAAAAFERAVAVARDNVHARFCLAEIRRALGDNDRAGHDYRLCLELDPEDRHGAALGLALIGAAPPPDKAPEAYVRQLFDDYAESFDESLVEKLEYKGPELLADALARVLGPARDLDVLDLGCGTGLAALLLRPMARRLDGIDLSPAMVAKAAERGLYDDLAEDDAIRALEARPGGYDLLAAADMLGYVGALEGLMAAAAAALRPGGAFAFTAERAESGETFVLGRKNRYAHSPDYVRDTAEAAGLRIELMENSSARREAGKDVPGLVAVAKKP